MFTEGANHKTYRIYRYLMTIVMIMFLIVWLAVASRWYDGNGFTTISIILWANFQLLCAFHKVRHATPRSASRHSPHNAAVRPHGVTRPLRHSPQPTLKLPSPQLMEIAALCPAPPARSS
jgi:hypothetical protein